jgi:cytidylate kinase
MSVIAISRGTFSGGEAVARAVAERLGYRCVGREVILEAAFGYGVPPEEVSRAMEARPSLWRRLAGQRETYLTLVRATLCQYAVGGNVVYHGHLGHLFLPGVSHVVSVRVIADMAYRVQAAMRMQTMSRQDALAYIQRVDRERQLWTRFLFAVDWDDPRLYDLLVNLSRMSVDTACDTVAQVARRSEFQPTPVSLRAMRELALRSQVSAALVTDPRTKDAHLEVSADQGVVTIVGTTQSPAILEAVPLVARQVEGVTEVVSHVRMLREGAPVSA